MTYLAFDFETTDRYIDRGLGSGWVYGIHDPNSDFKVLGCAFYTEDGESWYETEIEKIVQVFKEYNKVIAHNASYDLGCLEYIGVDTTVLTVFDTLIAAKFFNSSLDSFSLSSLASRYLGEEKVSNSLGNAVWEHDLYPWTKKELNEKHKLGDAFQRERPPQSKLNKYAIKNLALLAKAIPETVAKYAMIDAKLSLKLKEYFCKGVDENLVTYFGKLVQASIYYRKKGVRIDLHKAKEIEMYLDNKVKEKMDHMYSFVGREFNMASFQEVSDALTQLKIKHPISNKGNPSITTPWLQKQSHPFCEAILEARKYNKIKRDFISKIIDIQKYTCPNAGRYGRIFPDLRLFGASTGRFSCEGPNIQQIPSRDPELGPLCRAIFVPEEGEKWYSLDFSNQEGRIQVHYAYKLKCKGADIIRNKFLEDPNMDMHGLVAEIAQISRQEAKTINLGLSYGMGITKLARSLGVSEAKAKALKNKYNTLCPYLDQLFKLSMNVLKTRGFIKTIHGRKLRMDPSFEYNGKTFTTEYKGLNKLIQGSAADQTMIAMINAFEKRLPILFPIHDQFCLSGSLKDAEELDKIMKSAILLEVPVEVDWEREGGSNWADAGH